MVKIIYNDFIPFEGFKAMAFWPWIFVRNHAKSRFTKQDENHEKIHLKQQIEMLRIGIILAVLLFCLGCSWWSLLALPIFFWWYLIEWIIRSFQYDSCYEGYKNIAFEREAYYNENNLNYLKERKMFSWITLIQKY